MSRGKGKEKELDYWRDYFRSQDEHNKELQKKGKAPHGINVVGENWQQSRYLYPQKPTKRPPDIASCYREAIGDNPAAGTTWDDRPEPTDEEWYRMVHLPVIESGVLISYRRYRLDILRYAIFTTLRQRQIAEILNLNDECDDVIKIHFKNFQTIASDLFGDVREGERLYIQKRVSELRLSKRYVNARIAKILKRDLSQINRTLRALFKKMVPIVSLHGASVPFMHVGERQGKRAKCINLSEIEGD